MTKWPTKFALAAVVFSASCGFFDSEQSPPSDRAAAANEAAGSAGPSVPAPASPGVQPDGTIVSAVEWFDGSLDAALEKASAEGKLVLLDIGAYWCPPCHQLEEVTFVDRAVGEHLESRYVSLHVDAEKGDGPEIAERYRTQAYPTVIVLESSGLEKGRIVDFVEPKALLEKLATIEAGGNLLSDLEAALEKDPDDLNVHYRLANALALISNRERAEKHFEIVLVGDPKNSLGLAGAVLFDRAVYFTYKLDGDHEKAIEQLHELQRRFPTSKEAVRAHRQIGRMLHLLGRDGEALASLDKMVATDPANVDLKASYGWFSFREKLAPDRGLAVVEAGLAQDPENAELHYLRAELLALSGRSVDAVAAITRASQLEPLSAYYKRQVRRFTAAAAEGSGE